MVGVPYFQLSGFYFFYFAALGAILPFWGLYLREMGYTAAQIGAVFGALMGTKIVAPYVWGWIADHLGGRIYIIRIAAICTLAVFTLVPYSNSFLWMALLMTVYGFFWNAALPQVEVVTFNHLAGKEEHYGRIRLWGSIGFILSVVLLGRVLEAQGLAPLPLWIIAALGGVVVVSCLMSERGSHVHRNAAPAKLWPIVKRPEVLSLLLACLLIQLSHGPYYTFFSIYLEDNGYTRSDIGLLWSLGVFAEIGVFLGMPFLARTLGMRRLFMLSIAITVLRWALLATAVENAFVLIVVQLMHMASFGLYHAVAVNLIHRFFKGRLQGRGQALYSSVSFGVGGGLGSFLSGFFWDYTSPTVIYASASLCAVLALLLCWRLLHVPDEASKQEAALPAVV